jgi:small subunit ribosomal protein S30e
VYRFIFSLNQFPLSMFAFFLVFAKLIFFASLKWGNNFLKIMPGSHGSLTKAGKVRSATPKVDRTGVNKDPKEIPRIRNKANYIKRVINDQYGGQATSMGAQKHDRKKY